MIGTLKKIFALTILLILSLSIIACGSEPKAILSLPGSVDNNGCLTLSVSSSTESIDLNDYMIFNEKSKVKFYSSDEMKDEIDSVITLNTGDNYIYVKVKEGWRDNPSRLREYGYSDEDFYWFLRFFAKKSPLGTYYP